MQTKPKKCKGTGKAKGYGCEQMTVFRKYGLCSKCLSKWTNETKDGKDFLSKHTLRAKRKVEREKRAKSRAEKQRAKTLGNLKNELQKEVNTIVRMIDEDRGCISCTHGHGGAFTRQAHAGHYHSVGSNPSLRFNLHNIHKQCSIDNNYKSGALREYRLGLISRYGEDYMQMIEELKLKYPILKITKHECEIAIKTARKIIREIKNGRDYTRDEVNNILGLYKQ